MEYSRKLPATWAMYFLAFLDWSKKWWLQLMLVGNASLPTSHPCGPFSSSALENGPH